jgi:hypothetical protein
MKNIILIFVVSLVLYACQDKIAIDVKPGASQLAVDGSMICYDSMKVINPLIGYQPNIVRLTMTNGYDDGKSPVVSNATVTIADITDAIEETLVYTEDGKYATTTMVGKVGHSYKLTIVHDGNTYTATDKINRVCVSNFIIIKYPKAEFGRAPGFYLFLTSVDLLGVGDYYRIKTFKNDLLFNRPGDITVAYDAGVQSTTISDNVPFAFPIAVFGVNPRTGVIDKASSSDESTFIEGDRAKVQIESLSKNAIDFYARLKSELTNEGLFARPAVNVPTNIININPNGTKPVGWFTTTAISAKEMVVSDSIVIVR